MQCVYIYTRKIERDREFGVGGRGKGEGAHTLISIEIHVVFEM